jgi:hypothetical protein
MAAGQSSSRHAAHYLVDDLPVDRYAAPEIQPELKIFSGWGSVGAHLEI